MSAGSALPPGVWEPTDPDSIGWDAGALGELVEFAEAHGTDQLVILEHGQCVVNQAFDCSPEEVGDVFAVQKGLFRVLLAIASERGVLDLDAPLSSALPAGWTQLPPPDEARLTVRHVLTMTTGMNDRLEARGEIGRSWRYNNTAYNYLKRILVERTGLDLQELTRNWLLGPLGMTHTRWIPRDQVLPDGRPVTGLEMSALDMGRLGHLLVAKGCWGRARVLQDPAGLRSMFEPGSEANPAWCEMWWRNDQARFMVPFIDRVFDGVPIPEAPRDLVMAQGAGDNRLYVWLATGRVIARRGRPAFPDRTSSPDGRGFDRLFWDRLMKCIP